MNKKQMDDYFVKLLPILEPIVKGVAYKQNKKLDTYAVINEAYLHMVKYQETITTEKQLEKLVINFINQNIIWTQSKINKQEKVNDNIGEYFGNEVDEDIEISLQQKIEIEKWYDTKQCILQMYRDTEQDKIKQIVFDCYFKKGITKGTALAKHIGINKDYACLYIRTMKKDINDYYQQWLKDNNK
jgi:hypothetical protein